MEEEISMLNDPEFRLFAKSRPIAVMAHMAVGRLLYSPAVDKVFAEASEQQYKRKLLFSSLTSLMADVVLGKQPSVNAAYRRRRKSVGVSLNAVYNKLDRVEPQISQALVRYSYQQVLEISRELGGNRQNEVPGYRTWILDGNHLGKTEHRLAETRDSTAAPLPGKSLVVLDPRFQSMADFFPIEDGHAQERSALDAVLETVERNDLWVADRNFCTLKLLYEIAARNAAFVIRLHQKLEGIGLGKRRKIGSCETGTVYERTMRLSPYRGLSLTVRRIEIELKSATRDGDSTLILLTNLPARKATAIQIAEIYRKRWRIETAFQTLTESLNCEINTLCYPRAALFAFALALVAYNAIAIVYAVIARERGREQAEQLSSYYVALEIAQTSDGMLVALPPERWMKLATMPISDYTSALRKIARQIDLSIYRKSVRGPKKPKPQKQHRKKVVHVSVAKILEQRKHQSAC
jgi:IS4 transposase